MVGHEGLPWYARRLRHSMYHFPTSFPANSALVDVLGEQLYVALLQQLNITAAWPDAAIPWAVVSLWSVYIGPALVLVFVLVYLALTFSSRDQYDAGSDAGFAAVAVLVPFFLVFGLLIQYNRAAATHRMTDVLTEFNSHPHPVRCHLQNCQVRDQISLHNWILHFTY